MVTETNSIMMCSGGKASSPTFYRRHRQMIGFLIRLAAAGTVLFVTFAFFITVRIVHTNDMYPAIRDGQLVLFSRVTPLADDRIVLYRNPDGEEKLGRILGLPGNEIRIDESEGGVSVNGAVIYQTVPYRTPPGTLSYPHIVPDDSFFLLNDYRELETDSRTYGSIPKDDVIGVVIFAVQYRGF